MDGSIWLKRWNVARQLAEYRVFPFPFGLVPLALLIKQDPDQKKKDPKGTGENDEHVPTNLQNQRLLQKALV